MSAINSSMGPPTPTPKRQISESDSELDITNVVKKNKVGRRSTEEIVDDKIKKNDRRINESNCFKRCYNKWTYRTH